MVARKEQHLGLRDRAFSLMGAFGNYQRDPGQGQPGALEHIFPHNRGYFLDLLFYFLEALYGSVYGRFVGYSSRAGVGDFWWLRGLCQAKRAFRRPFFDFRLYYLRCISLRPLDWRRLH